MMEKLLGFLLIAAVAALWCGYQVWVYRDKVDKGPEMTGPATVKSHRVAQGRFLGKAPSRWDFLVSFTLSDGEELELYTLQSDFQVLKDGTTGLLTWQGKTFLDFDPDA